MINLQTSTFGLLDSAARQHEYLLLCSVLDCILRKRGDWIADVMTWFKPEYIIDGELRQIFNALIEIQKEGAPPDDFALLMRLPVGDSIPFEGRAAKLYGLWRDCASQSAHLRYYAKQVYSEYQRQAASEELTGLSHDMREAQDPNAVLEQVSGVVTKYAPVLQERAASNDRVMRDLLDELEGKQHEPWLEFGIRALDGIVGGVPPSSLVTIGARSSNGKSAFLGQMALRMVQAGKPVVFFTLEMSQQEMYRRWAAAICRLPYRTGERREIGSALLRVQDYVKRGLLNVFSGVRTAEQIDAEATAYASRMPLGLIAVDYIQAMMPTKGRNDGREQQVNHMIGSLKRLAMKTGVTVMTATQLNKEGENMPRGSTVRESESILNYSNILILLNVDAKDKGSVCQMELIVEKNRDYKRGAAFATWERPLFTIRDMDEHDGGDL